MAAHRAVRGTACRAVAVDRCRAPSHRAMLHVTSDLQVGSLRGSATLTVCASELSEHDARAAAAAGAWRCEAMRGKGLSRGDRINVAQGVTSPPVGITRVSRTPVEAAVGDLVNARLPRSRRMALADC